MHNPPAVRRLIAEIDRYLARLEGPGIAEVRAAIARFAPGPVRETILPTPPRHGDLADAMSAIAGADELRDAIAATLPDLAWVTYDVYPRAMIGDRFPVAHAFVSLIGESGLIAVEDFELGLFIIAPRTLYRDHRHKAPELYVPLTGPHEWRFGTDESWSEYAAHMPIWNESMRIHATLVRDIPFLALFAWTKDVKAGSAVVAAPDWAEIEARL
ncbi:hypothetical protein G5V57_21475 [Nordella sp. HKS 07]|uniref:dimethylsulfonioproprionate lyase family protein n=1 Tax=Nordella sp. HKS 07 TaxID=2712222 RepID=UPI0013E1AA24|nr:dimethylsulfonioproprionate lyase family protein [Nordella sp. HKS 07]QIG50063.1 hypothetical protein G5V57_21475 [Nordella sp. HKS 07]